MNLVLALGLLVTAGILGSLLFRRLGLPSVTGYIIVGVFLGPSITGVVSTDTVAQLGILTSITLGVVAYLIGGSLQLDALRGLGKSVAWITLLQSLGACVLVSVVLSLVIRTVMPEVSYSGFALPMAIIVGAISSATAPAATMAIVRELRARGPLTTTLLAVVALDDAVAVIAFAVALGICVPLVNPGQAVSLSTIVLEPAWHIGASMLLGAALTPAPFFGMRFVRGREAQMALTFGTVLLCSGIAMHLGLSLIMANMTLGFLVVNLLRRSDEPSVLGDMETILYTLFFVLAGLHFDIAILSASGVLALTIVLARCVGKYSGTVLGATVAGAPPVLKRYLGLALLPKAGVTVGLALLAAAAFPSFGDLMLNAVLASTIVNELIAPPLTRYAILKAGEASPRG